MGVGKRLMASSLRFVQKSYVAGDDPLKYLLPWEQKAAEVYVRVGTHPEMTNMQGNPYADDFHAQLFLELPTLPRRGDKYYLARLRMNAAWMAYVKYLREHARDAVLNTLHDKAGRAVDNYLWAQEAARKAEDYKETRVASADHLDRIGATEKPPTQVVQVANIVLRGRNYSTANLLAEGPQLEGEAVTEEKHDDAANG